VEKIKKLFLELRKKLEEKIFNFYNEAEQAIVMEWGMVETMVVSQYFPDKGFGFAKSVNGKRYFFHVTGDVEYGRRAQKVLQVGQKIFSFTTQASEKGLQVVKWSEDNSFIEKKMNEFKKNFRVDEAVIRDVAQEFFFKNLSDGEILDLGPVSASFRIIISTVGMPVEINTDVFRINLFGDEATQELFLQISHGEQIRKVKILTPMPFKRHIDSWRGVVFSIGSIEDYIGIKNSTPEGLDTYVVGDKESQCPPEGQPNGEYFMLKKRSQYDLWSIDEDDWSLALLQHPKTKILGAKEGTFQIQNELLDDEVSICVAWISFIKKYEGYSNTELFPYLESSVKTEKKRRILEKTLPILLGYLQDEWTEKWIINLEKDPEKFFIKKKEHIFSGNIIGEYYYLDENPLGKKNVPNADEGRKNFPLLNEEEVISASERVLSSKREDFEKEIRERNYFSGEKTQLHRRIPVGRERVKKILNHLLPGEGRVREFSFSENISKKENEIIFDSLVGGGVSADMDCTGMIDTKTGIILFEKSSGIAHGSWTHSGVMGGDGWRRGAPGKWTTTQEAFNSVNSVSILKNNLVFQNRKNLAGSGHFFHDDEIKSIMEEIKNLSLREDVFCLLDEKFLFEKSILLDTLKSPQAMADRFDSETKGCFQIPYEGEWSDYYSLSEVRQVTQNKLNELKSFSEGLTPENIDEQIQFILTEAEKIKREMIEGYTKTKALVSETREFFEKTLAEVEVSLVLSEVNIIREFLDNAWRFLNQAEFQKAENFCNEVREKISSLSGLAVKHGQEKEAERERLGIPENLLNAFGGEIETAIKFISNVAKIETWRLDAHELTCGRSRASSTCENAWSAMGESTDFFCGADPNDVKWYVYEHHFGENSTPVARKEEKGSYNKNLSTSNIAMAEALRKAGLR
jgi:cold shock CspA family protein